MRARKFLLSVALLIAAVSFQAFASPESADDPTLPLVDLPTEGTPPDGSSDDDDGYKKEDPTKRQRMPARPVNCTISHEGVSIEGIAESVETFEVRDMDGNLVALFSEEKAFISFIFSTEGDFELIFCLPSRTLHGFISL